ncbi:hypothetical protein KQI77_08485 [Clostridium sp. MSJ-8]|uniref:hypothetical protein n=1 Tax=Clostridium sp. MSJ-8 TaxID=2841510 RepID=UPI001C0E93AE|nr:hypothetical protein [Clostridium sp. MSJ-8]MBU5488190.1 hypothetical protein [Clostridium sp. MSJ-8]
MKKIINVITIISAIITSLVVICTFLTSYQFVYIDLIFNSYKPIQISLAITMLLLATNMIVDERKDKKHFSVLFCIVTSIVLIVSIGIVK